MKIIECPRDAMQGLKEFIPTQAKVRYINALLRVGFDTIDFGSFVSPRAIPQMKDTAEVLAEIGWRESSSKLLAIVANTRGAEDAAKYPAIQYLGFPLSVSDTFQQRNTNRSIAEALDTLAEIKNVCERAGKKLVTYISMGFGNPYGDPYSPDLVAGFVDVLLTLGSDVISLADTIGIADPEKIRSLFAAVNAKAVKAEVGLHLHSTPETARDKIHAAYSAGCRRLDGALRGFGGCPMARDELVGNIATEKIVSYLDESGFAHGLDGRALQEAMAIANEVFPH